ncbi:hypothetical protein OSTOST_04130 [Ostertagia ostertagi]
MYLHDYGIHISPPVLSSDTTLIRIDSQTSGYGYSLVVMASARRDNMKRGRGRYLLLNAIANQLRYPNAHTHFSCVFLFLFLNSDHVAIQQITRILFERLALRPHPWGLLIAFIEFKNPVYNFWKYKFTRCAPEIEREHVRYGMISGFRSEQGVKA